MMKRIFIGSILMLLLSAMLAFAFVIQPVKTGSTIITVPDDYPTIQAAINAASPGDMIFVKAGTYSEHVVVNKTLEVIGENTGTTVIDGYGTGVVVTVTASNVNISDFTIQRSGSEEWSSSGIYLHYANNCNVIGNHITKNKQIGIVIYYSSHNIIAGNNITENEYYGIGVAWSTYNTLSQNNVKNNSGYGISLLFSSYNSISGNDIINNGYVIDGSDNGVSLSCSSQNTISGNSIINNKNGMSLSTVSNNNTISENIIADNGDGISIYYSSIYYPESVSGSGTYNIISENIIVSNNRSGISLSGGATNNIILHNSIVYNMKQADEPTYTNTWDDGARGNFWSDYNGADLDGDGIGDTAYVIDVNNQDRYPLIVPLVWNYSNPVPIVWEGTVYQVALSSNSTISTFKFNQPQMQISFDLEGLSGTIGYCNVTIPNSLLTDNPWTITINGVPKTDYTKTENDTHTFLYFTYTHESTLHVTIQGTHAIPEFPPIIILPLFMVLTIIAVVFAKRKFQEGGGNVNC
jgi:parallel beta-helix repeat protein